MNSREYGFTFVEMIIAMTVMSIAVTILAGVFVTNAEIFNFIERSQDDISELRLATSRTVLEVRAVKDKQSIIQADAANFEFKNSDGDVIYIKFDSGSSILKLGGQTLATGLSSFEFRYFDKAGNILTTPTKVPETNIWSVEIEMERSGGGDNLSMIARIHPRNFV
jgi:prepilin-type N-terminal cleavage/methylation domain-containing protein